MAYFEVRRGSVILFHGACARQGGVRNIALHTLAGLDELRACLRPDGWARLQMEVEQRHPEVVVDWRALRQQALELTSPEPEPPRFEDRVFAARKAFRRLLKRLYDFPPAERELAWLCLAPEFRDVLPLITEGCAQSAPLLREYADGLVERLLPDEDLKESAIDKGRRNFERGRLEKAANDFAFARRIDISDPDTLNSEAIGWMEAGQLEKAESLLLEARILAYHQLPHPHRSYSWSRHEVRPYLRATSNLALLKERQGHDEESLDLCRECLQRCPDDGMSVRFRLGPLLQKLGRLHEAAVELRNARYGSLVNLPDPFYSLFNVEAQLGHYPAAIAAFLEGLRINRHIPRLLLKPPARRSKREPAGVESVEWAKEYVADTAGQWPQSTLDLIARMLKDKELKRSFQEQEVRLTLVGAEGPGQRRLELFEELQRFRDRAFGPDAAGALHARLFTRP